MRSSTIHVSHHHRLGLCSCVRHPFFFFNDTPIYHAFFHVLSISWIIHDFGRFPHSDFSDA
ncbi:hypothetical protein HMI54_007342 [Coelomomyces lativittatus]|nr:hypothetical protein HMI54_007342 [Coelomomyces lativittatus]